VLVCWENDTWIFHFTTCMIRYTFQGRNKFYVTIFEELCLSTRKYTFFFYLLGFIFFYPFTSLIYNFYYICYLVLTYDSLVFVILFMRGKNSTDQFLCTRKLKKITRRNNNKTKKTNILDGQARKESNYMPLPSPTILRINNHG